jgi:tetratricopeptide (TPR) repeat protein
MDYAFENNTLGEIHRFGLSWAFGPTVEESHQAALRAEEEAMRHKLADAFDERQRAQTARLMATAKETHREGSYEETLQTLAVLHTLAPDLPEAREMEIDCWRSKGEQLEEAGELADASLAYHRILALSPEDEEAEAAITRCRSESDRKAARSTELRQRFSAALDAFSVGNLESARDGFRAILRMEPKDSEAASMLERTESAISRRAADLLDQGERLLRAGLFADAGTLLGQARDLDPDLPGLSRAETRLSRLKREAEAVVVASDGSPEVASAGEADQAGSLPEPPPRPELSAKEKREVEELYQRGLKAMDQSRLEDAIRYWELVHSVDPNHRQVREHLQREYLMGGMDSFANGRLEEAVTQWEKALQLDPNDEKARGYLARAHQQIERTREILGHH